MAARATRMIDVSSKKDTLRVAIATARISMSKETLAMVRGNTIPKGDVLSVAQAAGIMAAKRTPDLIPLCHPLLLSSVAVDFKIPSGGNHIDITASVKGKGKTGFEMEALTAACIAALTVYDMCKMFDQGMSITNTHLLKKTGGKSGTYTAVKSA